MKSTKKQRSLHIPSHPTNQRKNNQAGANKHAATHLLIIMCLINIPRHKDAIGMTLQQNTHNRKSNEKHKKTEITAHTITSNKPTQKQPSRCKQARSYPFINHNVPN